jgi:hypothetical protein
MRSGSGPPAVGQAGTVAANAGVAVTVKRWLSLAIIDRKRHPAACARDWTAFLAALNLGVPYPAAFTLCVPRIPSVALTSRVALPAVWP